MINCFLTICVSGLLNGGGIGDAVRVESYVTDQPKYMAKLLYNFTFQLIVLIMLLNIVFGIIIDTFAQLRDEKKSTEDDIRLRCFICGIERTVFDKDGEGFDSHVKDDHN